MLLQDELEREKVKRLWELDARHRRQLDDERYKLGRLAQMQLAPGPVRFITDTVLDCCASLLLSSLCLFCSSLLFASCTGCVVGLAGCICPNAARSAVAPCPLRMYALQEGKPLLQHLMERHGVRGHFYGIVKKDTIRLAQMAAAEKRRREAEQPCAGDRAAAAALHRGRSPPGVW